MTLARMTTPVAGFCSRIFRLRGGRRGHPCGTLREGRIRIAAAAPRGKARYAVTKVNISAAIKAGRQQFSRRKANIMPPHGKIRAAKLEACNLILGEAIRGQARGVRGGGKQPLESVETGLECEYEVFAAPGGGNTHTVCGGNLVSVYL